MKKNVEVKKGCKIKKSAFNYSLEVMPDGTIKIKDKCGNTVKQKGRKSLPPIKKVVNTRTLTIMEAKGSQWLYLDPPGLWYYLP
jgi:hypothetical protein